MRRQGLQVVFLAVILTLPFASRGAAQQQSKCSALKIKFAAKAALLTAKCEFKAVKKGNEVDPECLAKAQAFLTKKWETAEKKGDCLTTGDQSTAQAGVDSCVETLVTDLVPTAAPGCPDDPPQPFVEISCADGLDNDCDGAVDRDDDDCPPGPCQPVQIYEGLDTRLCNNSSLNSCGAIGGDASNCLENEFCGPGAQCYLQCEDDSDCSAGCVPTETFEITCADGLDNDCDGLVDQADDDCVETCDAGGCSNSSANDCDVAGGDSSLCLPGETCVTIPILEEDRCIKLCSIDEECQ